MGNEKSTISGLEIDDKALEITDFWTHHSSNVKGSNPQNLSVFISEPSLHSDASFGKPSPLEKAAKNLMLHRHPCILKYISSWSKGSKFFLATEEVKPLVQVIGSQTTLQICIGLHSILRALLFLHENASGSHNNVCSSSIYVTSEGCWKLGGLEYFCRNTELNATYFRKIKTYRYENAISPDEDSIMENISSDPSAIDKYAFAVLVEDVLKLKDEDDVPGLADFRELCKCRLKENTLSSIVSHSFFTHDFMQIYAFLTELPLKSESEKEKFFLNLVSQLQTFPEKIVAEQLGKLLLSRMVLLDPTAQTKLLPFILKPKVKEDDEDGLLTVSTFQACLVPKLLQMFCVRDAPIRLLLLTHLNSFMYTFQIDDLKNHILPELLVGIKDTDNYLVSMTLRALADLVPILGAATVIGGNRGKLFTDGRPNKRSKKNHHVTFSTPSKIVNTLNHEPILAEIPSHCLPERPSPDGGEDKTETNYTLAEEENWSDWESHETEPNISNSIKEEEEEEEPIDSVIVEEEVKKISQPLASSKNYTKKPIISDITELDIKNSKSMNNASEEIDFFTDMEPVIQKTQVLQVEEVENLELKNTFNVNLVPNGTEPDDDFGDGWADNDLDDWDVENSVENHQ